MDNSFPKSVRFPSLHYKIREEPKTGATVNHFGKFDYIDQVKRILCDAEYERIKKSFLRPLLKLGSRSLNLSSKMVHCLLCRSLITTKENEIWLHFGAQPMRFSIREFHMVTCLKCSAWENNEDTEGNRYDWASTETGHTVDELVEILRETQLEAVNEKFSLAMLILIESILLQGTKTTSSLQKNLKLAQDVNVLTNHPWGRDAYSLLLGSIKKTVSSNLNKSKYDLQGFPLALHLWILESIPLLQSSYSRVSFIERPSAFICEKYTQKDSPTIGQVENIITL